VSPGATVSSVTASAGPHAASDSNRPSGVAMARRSSGAPPPP
jgi:hypothetical protein